jgi:hypothetical protein
MDPLLLPIPAVVRDLHQRYARAASTAAEAVSRAAQRRSGDAMKARVVLLGVLMCTAAIPVGAGEGDRLAIRVSPAVAFAPANLVVRATIPSNSENRAVEIVAESEDFYRSSEINLEGDRAPRTSLFEFRSLPPGTYEVRAVLRGMTGGERATVRQQVNVIAAGTGH